MENHLKRLLSANEVVHHKDGNKFNNNISNLELLDAKKHVSKHVKMRGRKWAELKCPWCGKIFSKPLNSIFLQKKAKYTCCSLTCRGKLSSEIQHYGLTHILEIAISENLVKIFKKYADDNSEETYN